MKKKAYIGDSVYAEINEDDQLVLTTEDGGPVPSNTIFIEPSVWAALVSFMNS